MNQVGEPEKTGMIDRLSYFVDRLARFLITVMMAAMVLIILFGVFNRFLFKLPVSWTEEVAKYLLIWISMLGSAVAIRIGAHVGVGLLVTRLGEKKRNLISWINQVLIMVFIISLVLLGMKFCLGEIDQMGYATRISMFYPFLAIPAGCLMIIVQLLYLMKMLYKKQSPPLGY